MSFNVSSESLRSLLKLTEKRERLAAEMLKIEEQISEVFGNGSTVAGDKAGNGRRVRRLQVARKAVKRAKRGAVKEILLAGLKEAGERGTTVKDLAAKLGMKAQNIHVWLHTTGKKTGLVDTVGKGIYRLKQAHHIEPEAPTQAPKSAVAGKASKKIARKSQKKK